MVLGIFAAIASLFSAAKEGFSAVINFFLLAVRFVLSVLPKPIKLILAFVIFVAISGLISEFVISPNYVCFKGGDTGDVRDDEVYEVGYFDGLTLKFRPILTEGEKTVVNLFVGGERGWGARVLGLSPDITSYGNQTFVLLENSVTGGVLTGTIKSVAPYAEVTKSRRGILDENGDLDIQATPKQQFDSFSEDLRDLRIGDTRVFPDQNLQYNVCYSKDSGTCILNRVYAGDWNGCRGLGSGRGAYTIDLATIYVEYIADEIPNSKGTFEDYLRYNIYITNAPYWEVKWLAGIVSIFDDILGAIFGSDAVDLNDCGFYDGDDNPNQRVSENYVQLDLTTGGGDNYKPVIYNAGYSQLFTSTQRLSDRDIEEGRLFFELQKGVIEAVMEEYILSGRAVKVQNSPDKLINYYCNSETESLLWDTEIYVAGIPILRKEVFGFILFMSFAFGLFSFILRLSGK